MLFMLFNLHGNNKLMIYQVKSIKFCLIMLIIKKFNLNYKLYFTYLISLLLKFTTIYPFSYSSLKIFFLGKNTSFFPLVYVVIIFPFSSFYSNTLYGIFYFFFLIYSL